MLPQIHRMIATGELESRRWSTLSGTRVPLRRRARAQGILLAGVGMERDIIAARTQRQRRESARMVILACALVAGGIAAVVIATAVTCMRYGTLPDRVPIHFGISGKANGYGPKPTAWLLVIVEVVVVAILGWVGYMLLTAGPNAHINGPRGLPGFVVMALIGNEVLWLLTLFQMQMLDVAAGSRDRLSPALTWGGLAIILATVLLLLAFQP